MTQGLPLSYFDKKKNSKNPIWCLNTADQNEDVKVVGEIMVSIPKLNGGGQPDVLHIKQTWLPQDLTLDIPRAQLLQSSEFRKTVNKGLIALISREKAAALLRNEGAKEEQRRLLETARQVRIAGAARTISSEITRADGVSDDEEEDAQVTVGAASDNVALLAKNGVEDVEPGVSMQFKMFCDSLTTLSDIDALNKMKSRRNFKRTELKFLARHLPAKYKMTIALANNSLNK